MSTTFLNHDSSIKIHTLGQFDVVKNNESLVLGASGSKKIWELFKFMLTHRDRTFTPESLADQLWVSEDYSDPRSTLRRQMHRLRQAMAESADDADENTLLFTNGYYRWNTGIACDIDADLFERHIKNAEVAGKCAPEEALEHYKLGLDLYKGDYLPDCVDQHWVFSVRNHYRRIYLKAVVGAVELLKTKGDFDEIVRLCQAAMKIDVYEEYFHLYYMEALAERGGHKQALEHYEHITGFFYREMGIKPSDEMKAIYKRLLQSNTGSIKGSIFEALDQMAPIENAFFCEPDVFKSIYELERRRCQRSGHHFSIAVVENKPIQGFTYAQEGHRMNLLKEHLMVHLRKGDSFTKWNDRQFVVLLPGVDESLMERVLKRVLSSYSEGHMVNIGQIAHLSADLQAVSK